MCKMLDVDERQGGIDQVSVCLTMRVLSNAGEIRRRVVALVSPATVQHSFPSIKIKNEKKNLTEYVRCSYSVKQRSAKKQRRKKRKNSASPQKLTVAIQSNLRPSIHLDSDDSNRAGSTPQRRALIFPLGVCARMILNNNRWTRRNSLKRCHLS